jgi:hypothetical protein
VLNLIQYQHLRRTSLRGPQQLATNTMKLTKAAKSFSAPENIQPNNQPLPSVTTTTTTTAPIEKIGKSGDIQTSIRTIYSVKNNEAKVNIGTSHKKLLQEIAKMNEVIHIIPNDEEINPYTNLDAFPANEFDFKKHFKVIEENNRITVCHDIITNKPFQDLKYTKLNNQKTETALLTYMKQNNIIIKTDKFHRKRTTSIGLLICINPDIVHRDTIHNDLMEALEDIDLHESEYNQFFQDMQAPLTEPPREEMEDETHRFAPEFEVGYGSLSYKDATEGTISIKTLDILCSTTDAQLLKEMFSSLDFTEYYKTMLFIPRGLNKLSNDLLAYKKYVDLHHQYMQNTTQFAIIGMTQKAFNYEIETESGTYTPKQILFGSQYIESIHTTPNTSTKGIWVIVTTKNDLIAATTFFDHEINKIYEYIPNEPGYFDTRNIVPTRLAKQRRLQSTKTIERATILDKLVPQTIMVPGSSQSRKQSNKRQIQYSSICSPVKQQKQNDNDTSNDKTELTEMTTFNNKTNNVTDNKFEDRIQLLEGKIKELANQIQTNEKNRLKTHQEDKQEITTLIKTTIATELPSNLTNKFDMMASQILDLNTKFDSMMEKLCPSTPTKEKVTNEQYNSQEVTMRTTVNSPSNTEQQAIEQQSQDTTASNLKTSYASPVNQWNVVGNRRKTTKEIPISAREKTVKETSVKERMRSEEKARQGKKIASKKSDEPMEDAIQPQL